MHYNNELVEYENQIDSIRNSKLGFCCRYKGGTTVTNNSTYTPTEYEMQLQKAQANYADAISPNSLWLNDTARDILQDSLGTVQVDFNSLNNQAQNQINSTNSGLSSLTGSNTSAANSTNSKLSNLASGYGIAANSTNNTLGNIANSYGAAANTANNAYASLQNGVLPNSYLQNMADAISSSMTNTLGKSLNSLANKGVLNSSVTNEALNDIESNTANTLAQNYLNNISILQGLAGSQYNTTSDALGNQANIANTQLSNTNTAIGNQENSVNQQYTNALNANNSNASIYNNLANNATAGITTAAAAQEAAQSPALALWQASLGLQGNTNSALAAAAGKGTTTSTSTQKGGGGLISGLLGGLF